jgi:hypothetical protein
MSEPIYRFSKQEEKVYLRKAIKFRPRKSVHLRLIERSHELQISVNVILNYLVEREIKAWDEKQ